MKGNSGAQCLMGVCPRCHAGMMLMVGIVILINAYWPFANWWVLVGWLLVIKGLMKMVVPCCPHCK